MNIKSLFKEDALPRLISVAMIITVLGLAWLSWNIYDFYKTMESMRTVYLNTEELRGNIGTYNEILMSSARLAALTGDMSWEERYRRFEKRLTTSIKAAKRLAPQLNATKFTEQLDDSYNKLSAMENQAFELVKADKLKEAKTILFGFDYLTQRNLYLESASNFIDKMKSDFNRQLGEKKKKNIASFFLLMFILAASLGTGFLALKEQQSAAAVAQLKRSQTALLTSASRLHQIIDNAPMPLLIANPENHQIIVANQAFCELVGYTFEKLLNMKATDLSADPAQDIKDVVITLRGGEKTAKRPIKWKRSDGTVYDVVVSANMTEYSGQPVYLATAYDIMERKHVESELKKHHTHIEDQVKKRTSEMEKKMKEMEEFHKASLADEARIMALKKEIEDLKKTKG